MGPFRQNEDWLCPDPSCGNNNFARRTECNKCGIAKPFDKSKFKQLGHEIGENMAEKSKGLFSAEDWQCAQCGNVNWARRNTCNVCMSPKNKTIENRTGFGGGFMERERNVEYKDRKVDEDNEYDEFGRKKRKYRKESSEDRGEDRDDDGGDDRGKDRDEMEADIKYDDATKKKDANTPIKSKPVEDDDDEDDDDDSDADLSKYAFSDDSDAEESPKKVEDILPAGSKRSISSSGDRENY